MTKLIRFPSRISIKLILLSALIFASTVLPAQAVKFNSSVQMQYDEGEEVYPASNLIFPHNQVERRYLELLFTGEFTFSKPIIGKRLRLGFRLLELQPSDMDKQLFQLQDERRFEDKIYAQLNWKQWEFWGGDIYETFGKGLALNLFENRDLYFDTGLRGGKVTYRSKKIRFKALYGQSRQGYQVQMENVSGVNFEYRPSSSLQLGTSLAHQEGIQGEKRFTPEIYAQYEYHPFTLFIDYAQRRPKDGDVSAGEGVYAALTAAVAGIAGQIGYKYYHFGAENYFQTPPIAQREITTKLMSVHPHLPLIDDQVGFEIDLSALPYESLYLNLNFSRSSRHFGSDLLPTLKQEYDPFWELYFESEYYAHPNWTLKLTAGWNEEARANYWQEKIGVGSEVTHNISDLWSVMIAGENMWVNDKEYEANHSEYLLSGTLSRASLFSVNFIYEKSSYDSPVEGDEWMGGELALTIKSEHRVILFYGRERGGIKCTSGVCRPVQPFEGFRLTYSGRF